MELASHIELAYTQGYFAEQPVDEIRNQMSVVLRLIHGCIKYLKKSKRGYNEPGSRKLFEATPEYFDFSDEISSSES